MIVDTVTTDERVAPVEEDGDPLWSVGRVAKYMDVSEKQVRRLCEAGELKVVRLGPKLIRIRKSRLEAFIASHEVPHHAGLAADQQ